MLKYFATDRTVSDLAFATIAKLAIILIIYVALFAAYDGRPVDTAAHLLGPIAAPTIPENRRL